MNQSSYIDTTPLITEKDVAELNRKMAKRAVRNMLIVFGVKVAILYSINRWARSQAENN